MLPPITRILLLPILCMSSTFVVAENLVSATEPGIPYSIELQTKEPIAFSQGFVFSEFQQGPSDLDLRREIRLSLPSGDTPQKATVQLRAEDFHEGSLLMVFSSGAESYTFTSPIREIAPTPAKRNVDPHCPTSEVLRDAELSISPAKKKLQQLVKMRKARLKLAHSRLQELLNGSTLHALNEAEKIRGLSYPSPLSASTPISEIVARMVAIEAIPMKP